jgi:hypothetical protein
MDAWMDGWMDGWMGGWVDTWMDGCVDGWMCGWIMTVVASSLPFNNVVASHSYSRCGVYGSVHTLFTQRRLS